MRSYRILFSLLIVSFCVSAAAAQGNLRSFGGGSAEGLSALSAIDGSRAAKAERPSPSVVQAERQAFGLLNQKRTARGLSALKWSDDVAMVARMHSQNMADHNFFSHRGVDGLMVDDRADQAGLGRWSAIGENIAFLRGYNDPVELAVEKWMQSPKHRDNLLAARWKESAIGVAITPDGTYYFTQVFLVRKE